MNRWAEGVVVYGMGRSGTSVVTGLFAAAGYFVGADTDLLPANEGNPAGYFENRNTLELNDAILTELDGNWFAPPSEERMVEERERYEPRLRAAFEALRAEAHDAPVAIKDPRMQVMLPLWEPIIGDRLYPVMVVRDPLEIAVSLARRDGTPVPFSIAAWEISMVRLLRALRGREVTVAPYAEVLRSHEAAVTIVGDASERLRPEFVDRVTLADRSGLIRPDLHRNRAETTDHDQHLTVRQACLWKWLRQLAAATVELRPPAGLLDTSAAAEEAVRYEPLRLASAARIDGLLAEVARAQVRGSELEGRLQSAEAQVQSARARMRQMQTTLEEIRAARDRAQTTLDAVVQSRSWRATAPLRRGISQSRRLVQRRDAG